MGNLWHDKGFNRLINLPANLKCVLENVHQVGSIVFETNFVITQLAMFDFYVSTTIGGLLQELNGQWSLLARWRGEQTAPHVT